MVEQTTALNPGISVRISDGRYLSFQLANNVFAIPLLGVKEVIGQIAITPIPQAPPHLLGAIYIRRQVFCVIDICVRLKIAKADLRPSASVPSGALCGIAKVDQKVVLLLDAAGVYAEDSKLTNKPTKKAT